MLAEGQTTNVSLCKDSKARILREVSISRLHSRWTSGIRPNDGIEAALPSHGLPQGAANSLSGPALAA